MSLEEFDKNVLNRNLSDIIEGCLKVILNFSINEFLELKDIHKVLLLNNNNELEDDSGHEYFTSKNISSNWVKYKSGNRSFKLTTATKEETIARINKEDVFSKWRDLHKYKHPLNTLLIYDNYVLTNGRNQKISQNLIPMIKVFHEMSPKTKKNIMIFGLRDHQIQFKSKEIKELKHVIRNIKKVIGEKHNVKIISHNKTDHFPHDRFIYTNLFLLERGKGFNIFNKKNEINSQDSTSPIRFQFIFDCVNHFSHHLCVRGEFDQLIRETESGKLEIVE